MPKFVLQDHEHIEGALKLKEYVQRDERTLKKAADGKLTVPEGFGFVIEGADKRYHVVEGAKVFIIMGDSGVVYVTLNAEYVQLRFDFTADPPNVSTKALGGPSGYVNRWTKSVSYTSSGS